MLTKLKNAVTLVVALVVYKITTLWARLRS